MVIVRQNAKFPDNSQWIFAVEALVNDYILYEHSTLGKRAKVLIIFPTYVVRSFLSQFFFKKKK